MVLQDAALVEACQLSDRYITARKLPDKAIDLVDEACASGRLLLLKLYSGRILLLRLYVDEACASGRLLL